jgi:hypothetical protein
MRHAEYSYPLSGGSGADMKTNRYYEDYLEDIADQIKLVCRE